MRKRGNGFDVIFTIVKLHLLCPLSLGSDQEDLFSPDFQLFDNHVELSDCLRNTLPYCKLPSTALTFYSLSRSEVALSC